MYVFQKCCGELAELTVDDNWQIADAGDQKLRRHRLQRIAVGPENADKCIVLDYSNRPYSIIISGMTGDDISGKTCAVEMGLHWEFPWVPWVPWDSHGNGNR